MIFDDVRSATGALHRELENTNLLSDLASGKISRENYTLLLSKFLAFYAPMEEQIKDLEPQVASILPDVANRKKTDLLVKDLQTLEASVSPDFRSRIPKITTVPQALGYLYVAEGSTLGGQVISRILRDRLSIDSSSGGAFFNAYGEHTGSRWKAFKDAIAKLEFTETEKNEFINTAVETFSTLKTEFSNAGSKF